jgi:drug/metabolite transporter (DMT)-like permease
MSSARRAAASPVPDPIASPVLGALLVTFASFGFSCMHALVRHVSVELHSFEVAFFRNFFGLLVLMPFFLRHRLGILSTEQPRLHLLRGALQVGAMTMFFTALTLAPLARISALSFTAPLFAALLAMLVLGETMRARRVVALVLGFAGALIIIRPEGFALDTGSLLVLGSSVCWATALILIKHLSRRDSSVTLTAWMGIVMTPLSLLPALFVWRWPQPTTMAWLVLLGCAGALGQLAMAEGFRRADATMVLPFDFTRLVWASLLGYFLYSEVPELRTWIGGSIIFASTTYIAFREARLARTATPEKAAAPG